MTNLLDLPNDVLALIVNQVDPRLQLIMRASCRQMLNLTAGPVMMIRLAPRVFFRRPNGMAHIGQLLVISHTRGRNIFTTGFFSRNVPRVVGEEVPRCAYFTCTGFGHSGQLKVELRVRYITGVGMATDASRVDEVYKEDMVHVVLTTTAEGDVTAVTVTFQKGFARRRSALVGRILGEVTKKVSASKAQMLVEAFDGCEDAGSGEVGGKGSIVRIVLVHDMAGSSEQRRVRVTTHPCDSSGDITAELRVV